jgi:outer membrane protein assembly factor BamB
VRGGQRVFRVCFLVVVAVGVAQTAVASSALPIAPPELRVAGSWPAPNFDLAGTRNARGTAVNSATVRRLHRIWRFVLPEQPTYSGVISSTPLVLGGIVYAQTLRSNVYALDARTGRLVWKRRLNSVNGGPNGLAAGYGRLFGVTSTTVFALDRRTGRLEWSRRVTVPTRPLDIAPAVGGGLVFAGTTAQVAGGKGALLALDASSGRIVWRSSTVRGPWAHPGVASGGGVWWTPTVDRRGGLFAGTANPLPWGGTRALPNGGAYRGPALYTDSLLALTASNGRLRWYSQVTPHDVRDYDFALPPMLARIRSRDLAIGGGKAGRVIAWDRSTRARVWTASVGRHQNDAGPLPRQPVSVCPGLFGGVLTPMALAHGRVFVPVVDLCMRGSSIGFETPGNVDFAHRARGELTALAAATGRRLWTTRLPSPAFGCATATGDVVFTTTFAGRVYALAQRSGRILWSAQEPAGSNACPAVAGNRLFVPAGASPSTIATPTAVIDAYAPG